MEYPRHIGDIIITGWNPETPLPENWVEVEYSDPPTTTSSQKLTSGQPTLIDGKWVHTWQVLEKTAEDYAYEEKISTRNAEVDIGDLVE